MYVCFFSSSNVFFYFRLVLSISHSPKGIHHTLNWYFMRWTNGWSVIRYRDEDTVYDVLRTTRQVDSLLFFFVYLFSLGLFFVFRWTDAVDAQRSIAQHRITMNQARIESAGDFSRKKIVINHVQLRSGNVRNIRFPISKNQWSYSIFIPKQVFFPLFLLEFYLPQGDYFARIHIHFNCNGFIFFSS